MNTLPLYSFKKWIILVIVILVSLVVSYFIVLSNSSTTIKEISVSEDVEDYVKTNIVYNLDQNFVDIYIDSAKPLSLAEIFLNLSDNVKYSKIERGDLFEDYLENQNGSSLTIGATGGPNGKIVEPGKNLLFARLLFENLNDDKDVTINYAKSTFIDDTNQVLNLK